MNTPNVTPPSLRVPPIALNREYEAISSAVLERLDRVFRSGHVILGPEVKTFETAFAEFVGTPHAVGVASGSDALLLSLMALGVRPGDEVITVSATFVATVSAILRVGARPVFVDILSDIFAMNPFALESAITPKTRAIIVVHLYGHPAPIKEISEIAARRSIPLIEDCAQAHGASVGGKAIGAWGKAGCFSFYATKNLGAYGDGGAITTGDEAFAAKLKQLRQHGATTKYFYRDEIGINSRLDEAQAAILNVKLDHLAEWTLKREKAAAYYTTELKKLNLADLVLPVVWNGYRHSFYLYTVRVHDRDRLNTYLNERGIGSSINYPVPVHLQPAFQKLGHPVSALPETERACREVLSLPLFPQITKEEQDAVLAEIKAFYHKH